MSFKKESVVIADIGDSMAKLRTMSKLTGFTISHCLRMLLRKGFEAARANPIVKGDDFEIPSEVLK
jgi:hypothetical protein